MMATTTATQTISCAPPFPDDVPQAPLLRLSLHKLLGRDRAEVERFNRICEDLGFFYLDLQGDGDSLLCDADKLFDVNEAFCDLPLEEKMKYDFSANKSYFGYKQQGAAVVDRKGTLDRNEFYNVIQPGASMRAITNMIRFQKMIYLVYQTHGLHRKSLFRIDLF